MNLFKTAKTFVLACLMLCSLCLINTSASYAQERRLPADTTVVSNHEVTIDGQKIPYQVTVGTLPVYGEDGKPDASLQYTYYKRTDIKDRDNRPILISFNGGPGTGSLWMHIGYTGPKRLKVSPDGYPVQPYGVVDNHHSILDVTDIVYVNPVNTGFSRMLNDGKKEEFFGVNADINYLADWIDLFISRNSLWNSPKYIIGESYGTTRVAGLAGALQGSHDIYLDGVILQGQCGIGETPSRNSPTSSVLKLPYYTSVAWYHKQLPQDLQSQDLTDIIEQVNDFTLQKYLPAVAEGGSITQEQKQAIAKQVARYSGLPEQFIMDRNLIVPTSAFWKELLRGQGQTVGRLDSRYLGIDAMDAGDRPDYNAELTSWENSFTPAINSYMREDLGFKTDLKYYVFGPVHPWDNSNNHVGDMLRQAMEENPALHVLNQQGYYDGACDVLTARYALWQMDAGGKLKNRIKFIAYKSGHMLYIIDKEMIKGNNDIRQFIKNTIPKEGQPIQYSSN